MTFRLTGRFLFAFLPLCAILYAVPVIGQHETHGHHIQVGNDSLPQTLGRDLDKGSFEFHARSFFMHTDNKGDLLNYNALAAGAGIGYFSPSWKGFHIGFSGFFVFQLTEHNIYREDPQTGSVNRYELLLFDMNDFNNRGDLDRLEELYIDYEYKNLNITLGRQIFNSPFLNEQDNRMRANLFSGLSARYKTGNWKFTGAFFDRVTIRGTVEWYTMEESYGVYPFGRNPFGTPSRYKENVETLGIGVGGVHFKNDKRHFQLWNYYNENVFNMAFGQHEEVFTTKFIDVLAGVQGFYQSALNNGGNENPEMAYILPDESTFGAGAQLGLQTHVHTLTANYLQISKQGRFLFPREWGREQFFASLPRERFEGSGGVTSLTMKYEIEPTKTNWKLELGASKVDHAELTDYENNKYGIPSYYHFMAGAEYEFKGYFEGLDLRFFAVHKKAQNANTVADDFRINRVDLWNFNVIVDYRF